MFLNYRVNNGKETLEILRNKLKAKKMEHQRFKLNILKKSQKMMQDSERLERIAKGVIKEKNCLREYLNIMVSRNFIFKRNH